MRFLWVIFFFSCVVFGVQKSVQETIAECRKELSASSPAENRRAAVLVLGKYDAAEVTGLLKSCLKDSDVEVRRSALVALAEKPARLMLLGDALLECLADEDVHVRRLASSLLPDSHGVVRRVHEDTRRVTELLERGLRDSDEEVRRNVLLAAKYFPESVEREALEPFLSNDSPEMVAQAISLAVRAPEEEGRALLELLAPLAKHPSEEVRRTLAEALSDVPEAFPLLAKLSLDAAAAVRAQALISRGVRQFPEDTAFEADVLAELSKGESQELPAERLLGILFSSSPEAAWNFVREGLSAEASPRRQENAWTQVLRRKEWQELLTVPELCEAMTRLADQSRIRITLTTLLRKHAAELTPEQLRQLQESPLAACRKAVLDLCRSLPKNRQGDILMEALMDDDDAIRLQAVTMFSSVRPENWTAILLATLEDPNPVLQKAAAQGLSRVATSQEPVRIALIAWLPQCQDTELKARLERQLRVLAP